MDKKPQVLRRMKFNKQGRRQKKPKENSTFQKIFKGK